MSEQHVRLNPVITLQHVLPLPCQVFQCSIKGVINGELFLSLASNTDGSFGLTHVNTSTIRCSNIGHWYANYQQNKMNEITGIYPTTQSKCIWTKLWCILLVEGFQINLSRKDIKLWKEGGLNNVNWSSLPCLLGHLILVSSGQLIQVGLQNGLHFLMVGRAERRGWGLAERSCCCCCRRGGSSSQGRSGTSLLLYLIVQILVAVGLDRHGWSPTVAVISGKCGQNVFSVNHHINFAEHMIAYLCWTNFI